MTCIVGVVEGGRVWLGGDSAGVSEWSLNVRADEKVFQNGSMLFGFTDSFRMGQILRYGLQVPDHDPSGDVDRYMATAFVDAVRKALKDGGWASKKEEREAGGAFLVGYQGQLFEVESDYQVGRSMNPYAAVGCGRDIARGALFALAASGLPLGEDAIRLALEAAERHSAGVRGPFRILSLPPMEVLP